MEGVVGWEPTPAPDSSSRARCKPGWLQVEMLNRRRSSGLDRRDGYSGASAATELLLGCTSVLDWLPVLAGKTTGARGRDSGCWMEVHGDTGRARAGAQATNFFFQSRLGQGRPGQDAVSRR